MLLNIYQMKTSYYTELVIIKLFVLLKNLLINFKLAKLKELLSFDTNVTR